MSRRLSITVHADLHGLTPDTGELRDLITTHLDETTHTNIENVSVIVTVNDNPPPVVPLPTKSPQDCTIQGCYFPMPHTHPTTITS